MISTNQLTNAKGREDHVASDTYNRANRLGSFLPQDSCEVDVVEGGYARLSECASCKDYATRDISKRANQMWAGLFRRTALKLMLLKGAML